MMRPRTYTLVSFLVSTAVLGCGGGPRPHAATPPGEPAQAAPDSGVSRPAVAPGTQAPASLAGSWALRTQDGARRGPRLELAIDSVSGSTFRIRVTFVMAGDVGIDPARFDPSLGTVDQDGGLSFSVRLREQPDPVGRLSGTLGLDTIRLSGFRWAGEDQTAGGTRWLLVKQR